MSQLGRLNHLGYWPAVLLVLVISCRSFHAVGKQTGLISLFEKTSRFWGETTK